MTTAAAPHASLVAAMSTATLMIVQQIGAKTARDTLFLSNHPVAELPKVMIGAALLSLVGALTFSRLLRRVGPARALPFTYLLHGCLFLVEWWLVPQQPALVAILLYLHMGALGPIVISGFWSLVNEQFDPHTAKRFVSRIAASAAFGGVLGGVGAERLIAALDVTTLLPALASVTLLAAVLSSRVGRGNPAAHEIDTSSSGVQALGSVSYLRDLAAIVLVTSTTAGLLDYVLKAEAAQELPKASDLGAFFALFHAGVSVLVFFVQSVFSTRALQRLGLGGTIALLPAAVMFGGVLSITMTRLWTAALVNGLDATLRSSLFRSGYELLYTPVDKARKRAVKTIIDVGFDRLGDIGAAGLAMLAMALLPSQSNQAVIGFSLGSAALGLFLSLRLHRGYVAELAASLKAGTLRVAEVRGLDATTQRTLTDTTLAMDREQLLAEIKALQRQRQSQTAEGRPSDLEQRRLLDQTRTLLLGDEASIREFLETEVRSQNFPPALIPLVIPLLGRRHTARAALSLLQKHAKRQVGVLVDAMLDSEQPSRVRRRIPRVLRALGNERASAGLLYGLSDPSFEVRYYCAQALFRLVSKQPELAPDRETVFELVSREAQVSSDEWSSELNDQDGDSLLPGLVQGRRPAARLEYVFMLLSSVLEPEPLELCLKAIASRDAALRGTALEYLENVLPAPIYRSLSKQLLTGMSFAKAKGERQRAQIVHDLHQSVSNLKLDLSTFRREPSTEDG